MSVTVACGEVVIGHIFGLLLLNIRRMLCVTSPADLRDDVACATAVTTRWVYVGKQPYRCSEFNVEFVWRQSTECQ